MLPREQPSGTVRAVTRTASTRRLSERSRSLRWAVLAAFLPLLAGCGGSGATTSSGQASTGRSGTLVARGSELYTSDGCSGCHSLNGIRITGPSWKGLAGSRVQLSDGRTVIASNAYLTRHIVEPDAMTVQGYPSGVMAQAIEVEDLRAHPEEVEALVAFIDSLR